MIEDNAPFTMLTCRRGQWNKLFVTLFFVFLLSMATLVFGSSAMAEPRHFAGLTPRYTATATPTTGSTGTATPTNPATAVPTNTATPTYTAATNTPGPTATATQMTTPWPTATYSATLPGYSTGFRSPATHLAGADGDGDGYERNPSNAFMNDGLAAVDINSGSGSTADCISAGKDRHDLYNYGFSLSAEAIVTGLEVRLDAKTDNPAGSPRLCVELSWDGGNSWTAAKVTADLATTETIYLLGGPADSWDYPWNSSHLDNTAFRLRVTNVSSDPNRDFWLDWVGVNVYYDVNGPLPTATVTPAPAGDVPIPLIDMGATTYWGSSGSLYRQGNNEMPTEHALVGMARANLIQPLDTAGNPSPTGKYVLLAVGMSNTAREFGIPGQLRPWTFRGMVAADSTVNQTDLILINGARSGQDAPDWESPDAYNYDLIKENQLVPNGLSEAQVQIVWLKVANGDASSHPSLPSPEADAYVLMSRMGNILRALKSRYPNLQQVFISSRIYAGYAIDESLNPEPYAYESGFAVKWLIEAQIQQMVSGGTVINELAGDLNYDTVAPWIAWGPYMWADGTNPRSDGLIWVREDFAEDGTHPYIEGQRKVAGMLLTFFKETPLTQEWFLDNAD